jgi:hypothetical protein
MFEKEQEEHALLHGYNASNIHKFEFLLLIALSFDLL